MAKNQAKPVVKIVKAAQLAAKLSEAETTNVVKSDPLDRKVLEKEVTRLSKAWNIDSVSSKLREDNLDQLARFVQG